MGAGSPKKARNRAGRSAASVDMVEILESRVLLSATGVGHRHVAHTSFIIEGAAAGTPGPTPMASTAPYGYSPAVLQRAYGLTGLTFGSAAANGAGQTIAIVDAYNDPTISADLHTFDTQFGLNDPALSVLNENGGTALPGTDPAGRGNSWAVETSLDVEWAHAIAPAARILLIETGSASSNDLFTGVNTARNSAGVSVVSTSWGMPEFSGVTSYDSYFTTPAGHNGVTFVASSGDSGAYSGSSVTVNYPAASPNVVAVGGTHLTVDASGNYLSETAWGNGTNSASAGGSGGGLSRYESQPSYQHGIVTQSTSQRAVPDVAMDADPNSGVAVVDSYDSPSAPWMQIGGTSLAAPMMGGVIAIADQGRALSGQASLTSTQTLSALYAAPTTDFHDVTSGSNGYAAGPGYDLVTGRGTPVANALIPYLAGTGATTGGTTTTPKPAIGSLTINPSSVTSGASVTLSANNVTETGGSIKSVTFYRESNGSSGLQTASDTLVGTGTANGNTWTLSTATTGFAAGSYTYYAVATDASGVSTAPVSATLTVSAPASNAPANDNFANALNLVGTYGSISATNVNATREAGEPYIAGNRGGKSVWFTWTAPASGYVNLTTHGSNFDTLLAVDTGSSLSSLRTVASNDDDLSNWTRTSAVTFSVTAGTTYHFTIDGYNGASGNIVLNLALNGTAAARPAHAHHRA